MTSFLSLPQAVFTNPAASILVPVALGGAVGLASRPKKDDAEVRALKQPPFRPPPDVFPPVWAALYALMGYAAHRALGDFPKGPHAKLGATLYTLQLGLNLAYMPLVYTLRQSVAATADVALTTVLNVHLTILWFRSVDRVAALCMLPYVAWLGFATYLSAGTCYLNGWLTPKPKKE